MRECARKADQLSLADGKRRAALGDGRFDAARLRIQIRPEANLAQRTLDARAIDPFGAELYVGFERAGEKEWVLQDDAEEPPQFLQIHFADVDAIDQNLAALDVVEAQQ